MYLYYLPLVFSLISLFIIRMMLKLVGIMVWPELLPELVLLVVLFGRTICLL
jgi:hypothetical protein